MGAELMKKIGLVFLLMAPYLAAADLPLSPAGQREAALYMEFSQALLAEESTQEACTHYYKAWKHAPDNKYLRRQQLVCALEKENLPLADMFADYIDKGENSAEDLAIFAFYQWRKGNLNEARSYYEQALEKNPEDTRVLYQYILLLGYIDIDLAAEKIQERKNAYPSLAHVIDFETGNIYKGKRDFQKALHYYNLSTAANPDYPNPYLARAEIYEQASQFFLMLHELEELENIGYESAAVYSRMGSLFVLVKDEAKAQAYFEKAKILDPADIPSGYFLALFAERDGLFAQAARYLRETSDFQTDPGKWLQAAFYEQRAGDMSASLDTLKEAYKRFEGNVEIGYFYGLSLHDAGRYHASARVLKGVLESNPAYENARLAYGFALEGEGKYKEMERQVRMLLDENPNNAPALNLLGFSLAQRGVRLDEAQELIGRALALSPDDRSYIDSMAWVYFQQGQLERALELLESLDKAFVLDNADVAYHLGATYAALNRPLDAAPYMRAAAPSVKAAAKWLKKNPSFIN